MRSADLSNDGLYRYELRRTWGSGEIMAWIMLNPSTADAEVDDNTIRKCMKFAQREEYDGIVVINLYARRCTKPKHLLDPGDPEGMLNWIAWANVLSDHRVGLVMAGWGAGTPKGVPPSKALGTVPLMLRSSWQCLGHNADGSPKHPLYLADVTPYERFRSHG
jgi:hypothetical protein